jgi:hypothetical protein
VILFFATGGTKVKDTAANETAAVKDPAKA